MTVESGTWLAAIGREELTFGEKISEEDATSIRRLMQPITALSSQVQNANVQAAWTDLQLQMDSLNERSRSQDRYAQVLSKVVSWLSAFRTYLNQWEAYWKQTHRSLAGEFKMATAREYDREDGSYAFTYKLRNYTDHVSTAGISISGSLGQPSKILGERESLINGYDAWSRPVLEMLRSQHEAIDLMPIFAEAMQGLARIDDTSANLHLLLAKTSIEPLRRWADRSPVPMADGEPGLISGTFDTAELSPGRQFQLTTSYTLSHERLDRLQVALSHPYDPLAAFRSAFAKEN